jgi:hypothetical protein
MLGETGDILSTNMYAYCVNNPVMNVDPSGFSWKTFWDGIKDWVSNTFGVIQTAETSVLTGYFLFGETVVGMGKTSKSRKPVSITFGAPVEIWKIWEYSIGIDVNIHGVGVGAFFGGETGFSYTNGNQAFDISINKLGRIGLKSTTYDDDGNYSYSKSNFNGPETAALVLILIYVPELIPFFAPVVPAFAK